MTLEKIAGKKDQSTERTEGVVAWNLSAFSTDWNLNETNTVYKYICPILSRHHSL